VGIFLLGCVSRYRCKLIVDVSHPSLSMYRRIRSVNKLSESTGPFSVAGWLACFGGCEGVGLKLYRNCMKQKGCDPNRSRRAIAWATESTCLSANDNLQFSCPAQRIGLLGALDCPIIRGPVEVMAVLM